MEKLGANSRERAGHSHRRAGRPGKGTLARRLAAHFILPHLDTGLLYRATACALLDEGCRSTTWLAVAVARGLSLTDRFDDVRLRTREMGEAASIVATCHRFARS